MLYTAKTTYDHMCTVTAVSGLIEQVHGYTMIKARLSSINHVKELHRHLSASQHMQSVLSHLSSVYQLPVFGTPTVNKV